MNSFTEENYLKAIYNLLEKGDKKISTNSIAGRLSTSPASVTDMLKKLAEKKLISYEKYKGVSLTSNGKKIAVAIIRKHRLWEFFLVEKLGFKWDEVHDMAEELEHIKSEKLVESLDKYLERPRFDPHGDPIPDANGNFYPVQTLPLSSISTNEKVTITAVLDHGASFLQYLSKSDLALGQKIVVKDIQEFDKSMSIGIQGKNVVLHISHEVASNLLVIKNKTTER
ncbi:MAG: metal-dependent transcriptional regulator [Bacteroidetes bacterium]|nr:MAG: metal-dependent transcriptional regulator [Bacteroidota bacterium]